MILSISVYRDPDIGMGREGSASHQRPREDGTLKPSFVEQPWGGALRLSRAKAARMNKKNAWMAELWIVNRSRSPVFVGNSRHSPAQGAQLVKPDDLLPMFIT